MGVAENLKRGSVELLLLTLLSEGEMYGYQLAHELELRSKGLYVLQESSMYPTLYRLLDKGFVAADTKLVGIRRKRIYYHLTEAGIEYLKACRQEYLNICRGVMYILEASGDGLTAAETVDHGPPADEETES